MTWWQNIPSHLDPIIFSFGFFSFRWYSLTYLLSFFLIFWQIKRSSFFKAASQKEAKARDDLLWSWIIYTFFGMIVGARIGYLLFYNLDYFFEHPLVSLLPLCDSSFGFCGLSFHGGLIGIIASNWFFARMKRIDFFRLSDAIVPAFPIGIFLVRIGNFLNLELLGRPTKSILGMNYPITKELLHPSALYEALGEGLFLWIFLNQIKEKSWARNKLLPIFLISYGTIRFSLEFFRTPDPQLGFILGSLSMGQLLSLLMIIGGIFLFTNQRTGDK